MILVISILGYFKNLLNHNVPMNFVHSTSNSQNYYRRFNLNLQNHDNPLIKCLASENILSNPQKKIKKSGHVETY